MKSRLQKIREYMVRRTNKDEPLTEAIDNPLMLSMWIAEYAHRLQYRINEEEYILHPKRVWMSYRKMIWLTNDENKFYYDNMLMCRCHLPRDGVQEVCLLHDVVEDTDFTIKEIEALFNEVFKKTKYSDYFIKNIKEPLIYITHDKTMEYKEYIKICMKHPISALVKLLDLQDNINVLSLESLNKDNYKRTSNYLKFIRMINDKYHFVENAFEYRRKMEIWYEMGNMD